MLLSEGQMSDALPPAKALLGDRGYDADWFRKALVDRNITACIPSKKNRKVPIPHDAALYRQRHKIETMFGRLRTGGASIPATIDAPTPSCPPSVSSQPSSSGSIK
ncbi:transposase [Sphingobium sp. LMA1-1-1.1]